MVGWWHRTLRGAAGFPGSMQDLDVPRFLRAVCRPDGASRDQDAVTAPAEPTRIEHYVQRSLESGDLRGAAPGEAEDLEGSGPELVRRHPGGGRAERDHGVADLPGADLLQWPLHTVRCSAKTAPGQWIQRGRPGEVRC